MPKRTKVQAQWTSQRNATLAQPETRELEMSYDETTGIVQLHGGPTGYENFTIGSAEERALVIDNADRGWIANFGGGGYARVVIEGPDFHRALLEIGAIG